MALYKTVSPFQVNDVSSENNAIYYEDKSTSNLCFRVWNLFICLWQKAFATAICCLGRAVCAEH